MSQLSLFSTRRSPKGLLVTVEPQAKGQFKVSWRQYDKPCWFILPAEDIPEDDVGLTARNLIQELER